MLLLYARSLLSVPLADPLPTTEPFYTVATERLYYRLPAFMRRDDALQGTWPLKRYLSVICDELGGLEALFDRINYVTTADGGAPGDTSDLVNATTADDAWVRWLAQLYGVTSLPNSQTTAQIRLNAQSFASSWRAGTKAAIAAAAGAALTGTKFALVFDHSNDTAGLNAGTPWDVLIYTLPSETASTAAVIQAVLDAGAKPAGVTLYAVTGLASWDTVQALAATWDAIEALGSWDAVQTLGL